MRRLLGVHTEPGTGSSGKAAYGDGRMFCVRVGAYLSGLSEAHTESISPTSSVPWKGTKEMVREEPQLNDVTRHP